MRSERHPISNKRSYVPLRRVHSYRRLKLFEIGDASLVCRNNFLGEQISQMIPFSQTYIWYCLCNTGYYEREKVLKTKKTFVLTKLLFLVHYQKIIHRDLKPSNLLRSDTGEVKIADLVNVNFFYFLSIYISWSSAIKASTKCHTEKYPYCGVGLKGQSNNTWHSGGAGWQSVTSTYSSFFKTLGSRESCFRAK